MTRVNDCKPKDYFEVKAESFSSLFSNGAPKQGSLLLKELRQIIKERGPASKKALKCFKGLRNSSMALAMMSTFDRSVCIESAIDFHDLGAFYFKALFDLANQDTGVFFIDTSAVDGAGFVRACVEKKLYEKLTFGMMTAGFKNGFLFGISSTCAGRIFISGFNDTDQRYLSAYQSIKTRLHEKYSKKD